MDHLETNFKKYKFIIIGAGFAGLMLFLQLNKLGIKDYLIIESAEWVGGQLMLYQEKYIYDIPGITKITAIELLNKIKSSIYYDDSIQINCQLQDIELINGKKILTYYDKNKGKFIKVIGEYIILTSGKGSIEPLKINNKNIESLEKMHKVFYSINEVKKSHGNIAVFGGGDSALDAVDYITNYFKKQDKNLNQIYLIHRRAIYTAMPIKIEKINNNKGCIQLINHQFKDAELLENNSINLYLINHNKEDMMLNVDYIFIFYGLCEKNEIIDKFLNGLKKLPINKENLRVIDNNIIDFAIGDIGIYENKRFLLHNYIAEAERLGLYISKL